LISLRTQKKVVLSDGMVITVKGGRPVSLRLPLELRGYCPIPLITVIFCGNMLHYCDKLLHVASGGCIANEPYVAAFFAPEI
jgi:hypothetical protein